MVLRAIRQYGPATSAEIIARGGLGTNINLYRARFTDLHDRGRVITTGKRTCTITGRRVLVWQVSTRSVQQALPKAPSATTWRHLAEQAAQLLRATVGQRRGPLDPLVQTVLAEIAQMHQLAQGTLTASRTRTPP